MHYVSPDPDQVAATAGVTWAVTSRLDLTVVALVGHGGDADRYGLLLGVSPKVRLW